MPAPTSPAASRTLDAEEVVARAIIAYAHEPGGLLPLLHTVQDALGWLPPESLARIADGLNLSRAEVHGVVSFYPDFRTRPPGRHVVRICRAEACQSMGANALVEHAAHTLGTQMHTTRADGAVTLEPVYCLGNCALSPSVTIDGRLYGLVSPARFDDLVHDIAGGTP